MLERLPAQIDYGERAPADGQPADGQQPSAQPIRVPDGFTIDEGAAQVHASVVEYAEKHGVGYGEAAMRIADAA